MVIFSQTTDSFLIGSEANVKTHFNWNTPSHSTPPTHIPPTPTATFHFFTKVNAAKVTAAARFKEDLELDSLDAVEVVMAIEEEFNIEIPDSEADKILSLADAIAYISGHPVAK